MQHPQNHTRPRMKPRQRSSRASLSPTEEESPAGSTETNEGDQASLRRTVSKDVQHTNRLGYNSCRLRIDAFLGEWLSPTYFQPSSHPPPSAVLVSQAKLTLQAPQEEIKGADFSSSLSHDLTSVDWEEKENEVTSMPVHEKTGLRAMAAVGHSLPKRQRNISFGTELANGARLLNRSLQRPPLGYNPPAPTYAMNPSEKIPPGYVAHARDLCLDVDLDWDSQHEPLDWGDGGPFDEEWGRMHRRFRNGFQKMIEYYETQEGTTEQKPLGSDDEEDLVIILVTHQAGCNALIRLLTGAPALHDVATASLTMAVRKQGEQKDMAPDSPTRRRGSLDLGISNEYEMKIIASTEHLRAGSNPLGLNSPRLGRSPAFASRRTVGADSPEGFSLGESLSHRGSATLTLARSQSQRSYAVEAGANAEAPAGLWRRGSQYSRDETADSSDAGMTPSLQSGGTTDSIPEELWGADSAELEPVPVLGHLPTRSASQRGLWGGESVKRDKSPGKRRWTAVERSP